MISTACTTTDRPLWVTIPGARAGVPAGWVAWMAGVGLAVPAVVAHVGAAGAVIGVLAVGWLVARRVASPLEWLRGYHVDDTEVTAMGPGRAVRRLPWYRVHTLIQERGTLTFVGDGMRIGVPLQPLVQSGAWTAVLARVVPELADELWALLEDGEQVRLAPPLDPPTAPLGWWAYAPALLAGAIGASPAGLALALGLAAGERAVALLRARAGIVTIHRAGVALHSWVRGVFAAWPRAEVVHGPHGLVVGTQGGSGRVPRALPNFWAAAAVIQMKAQLGLRANAAVHFRVRLDEDGFAVVGEEEPGA